MRRLLYVIAFTNDIEKSKRFYRDGLGIETRTESPFFVEFSNGPTNLGLLATEPGQAKGVELAFETKDIEADVAALSARGVEFANEIQNQAFGRVIHLRDPEGNLLSLLQPAERVIPGSSQRIAHVIVNSWDFGRSLMFYRDRLEMRVLAETKHWIELDAGGTRLALHARAERPDLPRHAHSKVTWAFEVEDVEAWAANTEAQGVPITTEPTAEQFGRYAEVTDPDGNLVVFREPAVAIPIPEKVAEAFEDDAIPARASMRKPVRKKSKAVSRLVTKPAYKKKRSTEHGKPVSEKRARIAKVRGQGPDHTRLTPKTMSDSRRAKTKPAIGRLRKAEARSVERKRTAVAGASKSKPVKRAARAVSRGRRGRAAAGRRA